MISWLENKSAMVGSCPRVQPRLSSPRSWQVIDTGLDETSCFFIDDDGEEVVHGHFFNELAIPSLTSTYYAQGNLFYDYDGGDFSSYPERRKVRSGTDLTANWSRDNLPSSSCVVRGVGRRRRKLGWFALLYLVRKHHAQQAEMIQPGQMCVCVFFLLKSTFSGVPLASFLPRNGHTNPLRQFEL